MYVRKVLRKKQELSDFMIEAHGVETHGVGAQEIREILNYSG